MVLGKSALRCSICIRKGRKIFTTLYELNIQGFNWSGDLPALISFVKT